MMIVLRGNSVTKMKRVLFVCTGNTCRSPMAEALFNNFTSDIDSVSSSSCGIYADGISPLSKNASNVLNELGITFEHISVPVTEAVLKNADYIICMTANHAKTLISMFPDYSDRIYAMPIDIDDPYGGSLDDYRQCREQLTACIKELIKTILGEYNDKTNHR